MKKEAVLPGLNSFLNQKFNVDVDRTADILAGHDHLDPEAEERQAALVERIKDCDRRLERYRTAIDYADGEIGSITKWIAEVEHERRTLQNQHGRVVPGGKLTMLQIKLSSTP